MHTLEESTEAVPRGMEESVWERGGMCVVGERRHVRLLPHRWERGGMSGGMRGGMCDMPPSTQMPPLSHTHASPLPHRCLLAPTEVPALSFDRWRELLGAGYGLAIPLVASLSLSQQNDTGRFS